MPSNVRSVTVRLDAMVAEYMRKMKLAGDVTDKTFDRVHASTTRAQDDLIATSRAADDLKASTVGMGAGLDGFSDSIRRGGRDIDRYSGRLGLLLKTAASLGPALAPLGATGIAGAAGLASQLGFAAAGALSLLVASQGVGDALDAMEKARLDPTVANLEAAAEAMNQIGPDAQVFVAEFQDLQPVLDDLRDSAAAGWFPGLTDALDSLESAAPRIQRILSAVSQAGGDAVASSAASLAGERWEEFFDFIEAEAPEAIVDLTTTVGALTHGLAELWMAFDPLNDDVSGWLVDSARAFDEWAGGLDQTQGFQNFMEYARETGPLVADAAGAIANALIQITQAAAPLGGPVLQAITGVANAIAAIANSPIGTPLIALVTALSAANLAASAFNGTLGLLGRSSSTAGAGLGSLRAGLVGATAAMLSMVAAGSDTESALRGVRTELALGDIAAAKRELSDLTDQIDRWQDFRTTSGVGDFFGDIGTAFSDFDDALNWTGMTVAGQGIEGLRDEARLLEKQIADAEAVQNGYTDSLDASGEAVDSYASRVAAATPQIEAARQAAKAAGEGFISFSDDIAGSEFSLTSWLDAFEAQVEALANFNTNIDTLRDRGLKGSVIDELIEQGPAAAQAVEGLANAGDNAIGRLNRAAREGRGEIRGMGEDAAASEAEVLGLGELNVKPNVDLDNAAFDAKIKATERSLTSVDAEDAEPAVRLNTGGFNQAVDHVNNLLNNLNGKTATTFVVTRHMTRGAGSSTAAADPARKGSADGSTVPNDGRGYRDYAPYMLAPLEEVISNRRGQADNFRPELKDINAGMSRAAVINRMLARGLAEGGTTGRSRGLADGGTPKGGGYFATLGFANDEAIDFSRGLKGLRKQLKLSEEAVEAERKQRDDLVSRRDSTISSTRSGLDAGIWKPGEGSVWGSQSGDPLGHLRTNIAQIDQFDALTGRLKKSGISTSALEAILADGDLATAQAYANLDDATLQEYSRLYGHQQQRLGQVSTSVGDAVWGPELAAQTKELQGANRRLDRIEAAVDRGTKSNRDEQSANRSETRSGAGRTSRSKSRGKLVLG